MQTIDDVLAAMREAKAKVESAVEATRKDNSALFRGMFEGFFAAYPEVEAFRWHQYTPHFNDGEACTFGVHDLMIRNADSPEEGGDYDDGFDYLDCHEWDGNQRVAKTDDKSKALAALSENFRSLRDIMEELFGDHAQVTVTREGVEVDEYSHD